MHDTFSLAIALAPHGIRVNTICPGPVPTGLDTRLWKTEEGLARLHDGVLPDRLGTLDDIGHAAAFFLSDASSWSTGVSHCIDGGVTIKR